MTVESSVLLPSSKISFVCLSLCDPGHCSEGKKVHIWRREEFKDASFLTRHPHISQTSIGLEEWTATQGGMMMKISSLLSSRGLEMSGADMGMMGEELELLLRETGALVNPPLRVLLGSFPVKQGWSLVFHGTSESFIWKCSIGHTVLSTIHRDIMVEIQVCLFVLQKSHEDTGIPLVSGIFSVISLVFWSEHKCLL